MPLPILNSSNSVCKRIFKYLHKVNLNGGIIEQWCNEIDNFALNVFIQSSCIFYCVL